MAHQRPNVRPASNIDDVYPGIDLVYYGVPPSPSGKGDGGEGALEYDFIVSPGADPDQIALTFSGADSVEIDANGDLVLQTGDTELRQQKPYIYQEINGARQQVAGEFRIQNSEFKTDSSLITHHSSLVTFDVGEYDPSRPLVIDPLMLGYSTYLGGAPTSDFAYDVAVDPDGYAYVTGDTYSTKFPVTPGALDTSFDGGPTDGFVAKLNQDGSALIYATYLGGAERRRAPRHRRGRGR